MSEYQCFEFLAVDRPLDTRQQVEVRSLSTRATGTATRFVNGVPLGNFRGNPSVNLWRYYYYYYSGWGRWALASS
jgi:hypothetical protein